MCSSSVSYYQEGLFHHDGGVHSVSHVKKRDVHEVVRVPTTDVGADYISKLYKLISSRHNMCELLSRNE